MMALRHPNIVCLLGVSLGDPLMIIMEIAPLGNLKDYITVQREVLGSWDLYRFANQIANALAFLEENRCVHRDVAARNVLIFTRNIVKLSDFGLARATNAGSNGDYYIAHNGGKWPLKWIAPESINFHRFTVKSDVWSFGVFLWELWTFGDLPYGELNNMEVQQLCFYLVF